ncbi:GlxA family transcriptional regulator [Streptomyces sp. NPDC020983]|uniref:GlxA family transcriptional regulator n=1 Tax=Streptomyces sp. NPDC020983 TaxID=3365106 RepID=UPI00378F6D26
MQRIGILVFDRIRVFEYAVAAEVWGIDRTAHGVPAFDVLVCGPRESPARLAPGLHCTPDHPLEALSGCDLVVVPGVEDVQAPVRPDVLAALRAAHRAGASLVALCSGAFVLAAAGILDGRRATAHWLDNDELARRYPAVSVEPGLLFVGDGPVWTSAGTAAAIDLCLHLIREDHGAAVAAEVARTMVAAPFRAGGQAQYAPAPGPGPDSRTDVMAHVRAHALEDLARPWTVRELAARACMSERTFARQFTRSTGATPLRWLLTQRVLAAQRLLEISDLPVGTVARQCGFGTALSLRQHFTRHVGRTPHAYRLTFRRRTAGEGVS